MDNPQILMDKILLTLANELGKDPVFTELFNQKDEIGQLVMLLTAWAETVEQRLQLASGVNLNDLLLQAVENLSKETKQ